jgi:prepilin-type N-terminal cleavage/methylation domain-containing protein
MITPFHKRGFTLIEMIVALGVFAVVVTITGGALLTLIATNQRFHHEQNIMSNISFVIDSMTRELRSGIRYYCASSGVASTGIFGHPTEHEALGTNTNDCPDGRLGKAVHGVSFIEGGDSITGTANNRILYFYHEDEYGTGHGALLRRIGNRRAEVLTPADLVITDANFFVSDTDTLFVGGDVGQPSVTIFVSARAASDTSAEPKVYHVQTTIAQRSLDL